MYEKCIIVLQFESRYDYLLNDDMVESILQEINGINETIYKNDVPKFLAISRGFITNVVIDTEGNIITMSLVIEITLAYQENNLPVYTVH